MTATITVLLFGFFEVDEFVCFIETGSRIVSVLFLVQQMPSFR